MFTSVLACLANSSKPKQSATIHASCRPGSTVARSPLVLSCAAAMGKGGKGKGDKGKGKGALVRIGGSRASSSHTELCSVRREVHPLALCATEEKSKGRERGRKEEVAWKSIESKNRATYSTRCHPLAFELNKSLRLQTRSRTLHPQH